MSFFFLLEKNVTEKTSVSTALCFKEGKTCDLWHLFTEGQRRKKRHTTFIHYSVALWTGL